MTPNRKFLPAAGRRPFQGLRDSFHGLQRGYGFWSLLIILAFASFITLYEWGSGPRMYVLGEVADTDIAAGDSFYFQDMEATRAKRDAARLAQPLICTLDLKPVEELTRKIRELLIKVNKLESEEELEALRQAVSDEIGDDIPMRQFQLLQQAGIQTLINSQVLPWLAQRMRDGVVSDLRVLGAHRSVIVRNVEGTEVSAGMDVGSLSGVRDVLLDLSIMLRDQDVPANARRLVSLLFSYQVMPTLTPNLEATAQSAKEAAKAVRAVVHHVAAGEIIVRQGERIDAAKLAKIQAMAGGEGARIDLFKSLGVWLISLVLGAALFFTPPGRRKEKANQKQLLFVACMLGFTAVLAKAFYVIGFTMAAASPVFTSGAQAYAVPVAGAAGLIALASTTRRYYITSILLALFCAVANKGGLGLFLFYFMGALLSTWLVAETETRKEVLRSFLPLTLGLLVMWLGVTMVQGGEPNRFMAECIATLIGSFLSLVIIFALSPLVELLFGFTTRFALMELMNQSHPLLQLLMFNAPGTHHHSMIVASMVEQAAKAIGANSLLAKVAANYHDVGKIYRPEYFIENQFRIENPHNKITPTMSALILISHVKQGGDLARKYKLGREITDIILQHHGTRVIPFFYHKAKAAQPQVQLEDFCYDGPKPQNREAALIMLADVVEASSRTMENPTPNRIRLHVHKMIRNVLAEGQLNSVDMTFRDLEQVEESFILVLTGMFHKRIEYPGQHKAPAANGAAQAPPAPKSEAASGGEAQGAAEQKAEGAEKAEKGPGLNASAASGPASGTAPGATAQPGADEEGLSKEDRDILNGVSGWVDVDEEYEKKLPQGIMASLAGLDADGLRDGPADSAFSGAGTGGAPGEIMDRQGIDGALKEAVAYSAHLNKAVRKHFKTRLSFPDRRREARGEEGAPAEGGQSEGRASTGKALRNQIQKSERRKKNDQP